MAVGDTVGWNPSCAGFHTPVNADGSSFPDSASPAERQTASGQGYMSVWSIRWDVIMTEDDGFRMSYPGDGHGDTSVWAGGDSESPARMSLVLGGAYEDVGSLDLLLREGVISLKGEDDREPNIQLQLGAATLVDTDEWQDGDYESGEEVQEITIKTDKRTITRTLRGEDAVPADEADDVVEAE